MLHPPPPPCTPLHPPKPKGDCIWHASKCLKEAMYNTPKVIAWNVPIRSNHRSWEVLSFKSEGSFRIYLLENQGLVI